MFGYIKLDRKTPKYIENNYKKNYCFLCHSIWKNFGQIARLTLSFDVTFFLILLTDSSYLKNIKKIHCMKRSKIIKELCNDDLSKKISAFNMVLVEGELKDKIDDKDTFYAKPIYKIFNSKFKKIRKEYPLMCELVDKGYEEMAEIENNNGSLEEMEDCFANLIKEVSKKCFLLNDESKLSYLVYIAKSLYFMDAIDDIDKDIKKNHYNPLAKFKSLKELVSKHYSYLNNHIDKLRKKVILSNSKDINMITVNRIFFFGIPETMSSICLRGLK